MQPTTSLLYLLSAGLLATASPLSGPNQAINAVWSAGAFETIAGPEGGNTIGHSQGFSLVDGDGNTIKDFDDPNDHAPCYTGGRTFTITGGCFGQKQYEFSCTAKIDGTPKNCAVKDAGGNVLNSAEGSEKQHYIGIAVSTTSSCGTKFILDKDIHCAPNSEGFQVIGT